MYFGIGGEEDMLIAAMDQGWCFAYTCQKRLSTFWTIISTGLTTTVRFTGTPPTDLRLWMPYAAPGAEAIIEINFLAVRAHCAAATCLHLTGSCHQQEGLPMSQLHAAPGVQAMLH
jgi:hypothetical protein